MDGVMQNLLLKTEVEPLLVALAEFIKARRCSLGLTQDALATVAGLHRTYVSDVERGNRNLTIGAAKLLAKGLKMELRDLILAVDHDGLSSELSTPQVQVSFAPEDAVNSETDREALLASRAFLPSSEAASEILPR